ncbi:hypothetical protein Pfo_006751 [Paulownia fortunei]|nr:hypothetical protein Pfo_006751 [Paulownia fortunei]
MATECIQKVASCHQVEQLGRFAVAEYNKKHHANLEFKKVTIALVKDVVLPDPGEMYYLTLKAAVTVNCHKQNKYYEAKVWVQPCTDVKKLEEFKPLLGAC